GTRKELQAFLADVRGRGERWGIGAETLFGKDAKALANLVSACKKPKLATVDRINRYLEPIAGLQRRNIPLANRHASAWEKHKVEIWPGLGRENIATKPGKASKTKDTEGRPQAEQLYHVVAKVLSRLPQHFELVADIDTIENVITSAVTLLTKEEKAILAGAS